MRRSRLIVPALALAVGLAIAAVAILGAMVLRTPAPVATAARAAVVPPAPEPPPPSASRTPAAGHGTAPGHPGHGFDIHQQSHVDPASPWVVVNKKHRLNPASYAPSDLVYPPVSYVNRQPMRKMTAAALQRMFADAGAHGIRLTVQSAYRSYATQLEVYGDDVAEHGRAYADTDTARPGYSEHQTGLAVDISDASGACSLQACFGTTAAGRWLVANAYRFGFLLRYPADKVTVTGFTYEPWHFRYVGAALTQAMHRDHVETLEEYFGAAGGGYRD